MKLYSCTSKQKGSQIAQNILIITEKISYINQDIIEINGSSII